MPKKWLVMLGAILIIFGVVQILSYYLNLNICGILFSIVLIVMGVLILWKPKSIIALLPNRLFPLGDYNRSGTWEVQDERVWMLVGGNNLDFSQAVFPPGEVKIQIFGLVSDLVITLSEETALYLSSYGILIESKIGSDKKSTFFTPMTYTSDNYQSCPNKIKLEAGFLVLDLKVQLGA